jgi:integrase
VNTLREWKLACPKGDLNLVFPRTTGTIQATTSLNRRGFAPVQVAGGVVDEDGRPKFGLHAWRHFAASIFIEQGWTPKKVQTILGHSSIKMTYDTYGHLLESREDDQEAMAQLQARLLG